MYRRNDKEVIPIFPELFPFGGGLRKDNPWIKVGELVPWDRMERIYQKYFSLRGRPSKDGRLIIGLLIAKHLKRFSDREIVQQFSENPYIQYFCGYEHFITDPEIIHPSLLSKLRKKLGNDFFKLFEEEVLKVLVEKNIIHAKEVILDATIFPGNISFPTDCKLLHKAREVSCKIIEKIKKGLKLKEKIRTYKRVARKCYLNFTKRKKKTIKLVRKTQGKLLRYLRRNIKQIKELKDKVPLLSGELLKNINKKINILEKLYNQQYEMWNEKTHRIKDRIVSIHLPHIRPMVRGKEGKEVEFGPKGIVSWVNGFCFLDYFSFDAFNEGQKVENSINLFRDKFSRDPKVMIADGIFGSRSNRKLLFEKGIENAFKPLGRQSLVDKKDKKMMVKRQRKRNYIEGIIGTAKEHYGLNKILYSIENGEEIWVRMGLISMNLHTALQRI